MSLGAIYHVVAKILSRARGQSSVASAAYRSGSELYDERLEHPFDYSRKGQVEYSEILAPEGAPAFAKDRERLWNAVEKVEIRKDAQLARDFEFSLPRVLTNEEQVALIREYVQREFVALGMVADLNVHRPEGNPHAHVMLTMRSIGPDGFGPKVREWNDRGLLMHWREAWAELANEHLARAGHDVRIDHRSYAEQGIDLIPQSKIGVGRDRQGDPTLPDYVVDRIEQHRQIARENGDKIIADPAIALKAITHQRATFTEHDLVRFLHTRTDGAEQFQHALLRVKASDELVRLGTDDRGRDRFTSRELLTVERALLERAERMAARVDHRVSDSHQAQVLAENRKLSAEQRAAFGHVTDGGDLRVLVGVAGSGKSTLLAAARHGWEAEGLTVKGAALSGMAAQNLETSSGIAAWTLASLKLRWEGGRDPLTKNDVLVIDEAGLVGTRQLARVLEHAERAGAKVVLVGDPEQLQAIEAGAPFRGISATIGRAEMTEVHRQALPWQREATQAFAAGRTREGLALYQQKGVVLGYDDRASARAGMLRRWADPFDLDDRPSSQLMLAYTREDVRLLNEGAREIRARRGELGASEAIETTRGTREFAAGDRIAFLRNERSLDVRNGTLGTVERVVDGVLQVKLDGEESRRVAFDSRQYADLDHGYATTVYKSQGMTLDRTLVLATPHFDRHATYVALSRHRGSASLYYADEDFRGTGESARRNLESVLSRERPKELALDYLEREGAAPIELPEVPEVQPGPSPSTTTSRLAAFFEIVGTGAEKLVEDMKQQDRDVLAKREQKARGEGRTGARGRGDVPPKRRQKDRDDGFER